MARTSPAALAIAASRGRWRSAPHLAFLNDRLVDVAARRIRRLAISWPPRHGKTELASVHLPAWWLGLFPNDSVLLASYEAGVAADWSAKSRDILRDVGPSVFNVRVSTENNARDHWALDRHRGSMFSSGAGGPLTGRGGNLLICDDLFKNAQEANSPLMRDRIDEWFRSVALTRLEPDGVVLLIGTRWHYDDVIGRTIARSAKSEEPWDFINLPAIAGVDDPLGRAPGEALWPERFPLEILERTREEIGSRVFEALYQGNPVPLEGAVFQASWFSRRYAGDAALPPMKRVAMGIDGAWREGMGNSRSAATLWGYDGIDYYLLHAWASRVDYPTLRAKIGDLHAKWSRLYPSLIAIVEEAASGMALVQELRIPVRGVPARESKVARAEAITALWEGGRIVLPASAPWLDDYTNELLAFPSGEHDDLVDASVHALTYLMTSRSQVRFAAVSG